MSKQACLRNFLKHNAEPIRKPQDLAKRMAWLARMIRDTIIEAFQQKEASSHLKDLYLSFQQELLPNLKESQFADMFAQTVAYGLFAARCYHKSNESFRREDVTREIPWTNPFLGQLFGAIAGTELEHEAFLGFIDELAQVLAVTDMDAILADFSKGTRQDDPIIHFYETFLAQYDPKLKEFHGVFYTPQPVVTYIVRSIDYLLQEYFNCSDGLADTAVASYSFVDEVGKEHIEVAPRILILDPAAGTGIFLYQVIAHIRETYRQMGNARIWSNYVRQHLLPRLFGFELLMVPYAIAHIRLSIELAAIDLPESERKTWGYDFKTNEYLGIYLINTLDDTIKRSEPLIGQYISSCAIARVLRKWEGESRDVVCCIQSAGRRAADGSAPTERPVCLLMRENLFGPRRKRVA